MASHKASSVTIDEYHLPKGSKLLATIVMTGLMTISARRKFIEPRSLLHDQILARGGAKTIKYSKPVQAFLFYFLFGSHSIEAVYFALTKLKQHNVKAFSIVWLKWVVTIFLGGSIVAGKHFDEVVEQKEIKAMKEI
ncbi:uncharacterized protein A1O9_00550 [Exophiala aquamarina CBS 119918]|uniref:Uncharacterized protein n=1 Tax=Exophiala aquamarina CBS 119918 TaxID=1182545 RepID=A0A072PS29_9EURO|nr:uncharacterized protein A1O9_00550 [Exophiala aquamarina CBS 119918]KEF62577.1 hypothetical protein A1O9_00550 [Exophiala aquamarina CBS 119918]